MRGTYKSTLLFLLGSSAILVSLSSASAQTADSTIRLNEIVIEGNGAVGTATGPVNGFVPKRTATGSKTNTPIEDLPQSVSVVGRDQIDAQGAQKIDEALRYTAGVFAQPFGVDNDTNWIYIRGFDATAKGTYLDGLQNFSYGFGGFLIDSFGIERIEVLKGPASVLYGGSNPGGIVNYISKRPNGERIRYVESGINSYGNAYLGFDIGDKASDAVDYRINGKIGGGDNYTDFSEEFRGVINPSITWKPDDATKLTLTANYTHLDATHDGGGFLPYYGTVVPTKFGKIDPKSNFTEPSVDNYDREQVSVGYEFEHTFDNDWSFRQNARYGRANVKEQSLYAFGYASGPFGFAEQPDLTDNLTRINFKHDTTVNNFLVDNQLEGIVNTGAIEHTLLFGAEYKYFNIDHVQASGDGTPISGGNPVHGAPQPPLRPPYIDQVVKQHQIGVYAQDQLRFGDGWLVTLNGRYDYVDTEATGLPSYKGNDGRASGRVGIAYDFDNGLTPYASVATFFSPEIGVTGNLEFFKPETGEQYEVGVKYRPEWFDGLITASLFDLTKKNVVTGGFRQETQIGEVNSRGFEVEAQANIDDAWKVTAAFTAYDLKVKDDADESIIGKRPFLLPETQASLFAQYTVQTGKLEGLALGAGVRYVGSSYADKANTLKVPDVALLDLKVGYKKDNWGVDLNVTNVFDKEFVSGCQGVNVCSYGEGRKALLKAHVTW
ncbi:TonB-dependent siderophore receptor [Phyllobacterium sp. YR531]|uniref:TonB-dependent siderophore receptor n=1 Tax=Phyllobacterium sp. YR531 TaxID=1144343 RepID=UPI00026F9019|nr:TonB-dependent siderophore receptor [Phyllobacterium sp. YR531]EJN02184.1 TonB-dependent siderophore receptor [Phyllobacterium sp. YR531]